MAERPAVDRKAAGSKPVGHPFLMLIKPITYTTIGHPRCPYFLVHQELEAIRECRSTPPLGQNHALEHANLMGQNRPVG